jgi:hypothetical protein
MKKKTLKKIGILFLAGIVVAIGIVAYLFFMPHRNVQATEAFAELKVADLTKEFSTNVSAANAKYLSSDGNSKVLVVDGRVNKISVNQAGQKVIELKDEGSKMGVSCTFTKESSSHVNDIQVGATVKIKGAITAGNSYDADLDLYNDAVLIQCDIVK